MRRRWACPRATPWDSSTQCISALKERNPAALKPVHRHTQVSPFQGWTDHWAFPRALPWPFPGRCPGLSQGVALAFSRALPWATKCRPFGAFKSWTIAGPKRLTIAATGRAVIAATGRATIVATGRAVTAATGRTVIATTARYALTNLTVLGPNGAKYASPGQRPGFNGQQYPQP